MYDVHGENSVPRTLTTKIKNLANNPLYSINVLLCRNLREWGVSETQYQPLSFGGLCLPVRPVSNYISRGVFRGGGSRCPETPASFHLGGARDTWAGHVALRACSYALLLARYGHERQGSLLSFGFASSSGQNMSSSSTHPVSTNAVTASTTAQSSAPTLSAPLRGRAAKPRARAADGEGRCTLD